MWLLSAVAAVLGLVGGGAAVALFKLIGLLTHLTLLHDVGTSLPSLRGYHPTPWIIVTAVAGALVVSLFAVWSPVIRGHGIPESLEAILVRDSRIRPRAAIAKPLSAAITIGTGGPFGAEGPIIVTGGSLGSLIGQLLSVSPAERKILLATGAAAGMAATFNTPVAAVVLAIELVLFERSLRTIVPLSIACAIAAAVHVVAFGTAPLFAVHANLHVGWSHLPLFALVGLMAGMLAVVLNKGLFAMEAGFRRLASLRRFPVKIFWWPLIGALGFSLIGMVEPRTLSMGYSAIRDTLNGRFTVAAIGTLFLAKLISWWISLGSQTSGGTLAPIFLVSAAAGSLLGHGMADLLPGMHISPAAFALVAMGAAFGASTKAVFASVIFAAEVTGQYHMLIPLMIGTGVAELVAEMLLGDRDRMMTEKLTRRGFRVDFDAAAGPLRMRTVRDAMHAAAEATGPETAPAVPAGPDGPQIPPLSPRDFLVTAFGRMMRYGVDALPVVAAGVAVGRIDRADIAAEQHRYYTELETRQPGWLERLSQRVLTAPKLPVAAPDGTVGRVTASGPVGGALPGSAEDAAAPADGPAPAGIGYADRPVGTDGRPA